MTQGERVREIRKFLGLTLEKFGEPLGVTKTTISRIEKDINNLTEQMAKSICREFNINEEWLRTGKGEMFISQTRDEKIANFAGQIMNEEDESFKKQLIEVLSELTIEEWEILEKMALKLAGIKKD